MKELIAQMKKHAALFEKEASIETNAGLILSEMAKYCGTVVPVTGVPQKAEPKVPIFLAVSVTSAIKQPLDLALKACKEVQKSATIDDKGELADLRKYLEADTGSWKFPNSHHVTTLFIGGKKDLVETKIYKDFHEGEKMDIRLGAIVLVPHKLVFGICFLKTAVDNKIPHITLLVNHCPPKLSNTFGEALFMKVPELSEKYATGFFEKDGEEFLQRYELTVEGGNHRVYVYKPSNVLTMHGECKKFY